MKNMKNKISVIVTGRNDDYSGNLHQRMIPSLNHFTSLYDEVVYVDFNSPNGSYIEVIKDKLNKTGKLKCITVTPEDVIKINPSYKNKFIEVLARNIGIRRATGDYILSSNPDIVCERPNLEEVRDDVFYAAARRDIPIELYTQIDERHLPKFLLDNQEHFSKKPRVVDNNGNPIWDPNDRWSVVVCCGDYQFGHKDIWYKIRGFEESAVGRCYADSNLMKKAALNGFKIDEMILPVFHLNHNTEKYITNDKNSEKNCQITYVQNFTETKNDVYWGCANASFKENII